MLRLRVRLIFEETYFAVILMHLYRSSHLVNIICFVIL